MSLKTNKNQYYEGFFFLYKTPTKASIQEKSYKFLES